jgi:hypothetical protein
VNFVEINPLAGIAPPTDQVILAERTGARDHSWWRRSCVGCRAVDPTAPVMAPRLL